MATTVPKIQQGKFSPNSSPINQTFFNAAFAGRLSQNPVIKETYWRMIGNPTFDTFINEITGYDTDCHSAFSVVEYSHYYDQVKITNATAAVPAYSAGTNTVVVPIDTAKSQFYSTYILPQPGNVVVAPPLGTFLEVTAVTAAGSTPTMTLRHVSTTGAGFTIPAASEMKVLSGRYTADCACPSGLLKVPDLPVVRPLTMKTISETSGVICGKALTECQNLYLPFFDADGNETEVWYNGPLQQMYRDFEERKVYERFLNPDWGLIPTLISRGSIWTSASTSATTVDDIYAWGTAMIDAGVTCKDWMIFCGRDKFVQFQKLLNSEGVDKTLIGIFESNDDCKWLNLNWCKMSVGGLNLQIVEEPWMSNSLGVGGSAYNFRKAGIAMPLCDRNTNLRIGEVNGQGIPSSKMITTVFMKDNLGRVWDNVQDGNGIYGPRNTFGVNCDSQEWGVKTEFTQIVHQPEAWALVDFF